MASRSTSTASPLNQMERTMGDCAVGMVAGYVGGFLGTASALLLWWLRGRIIRRIKRFHWYMMQPRVPGFRDPSPPESAVENESKNTTETP